ncbi:uncharacterized protein LOC123516800, partial [Portunus trituberculatus]|uniref:uncharacterized protein LOC123516800 n=1 Tax=Portunus trituberculatus TaxID=210409 RepID=UPI001E1D0CB4
MNGSVSVIGEGQNGFIYCFANLLLPFRVTWTDPDGMPLPTYTTTDPPSTGVGGGVDGGVGEIYVVSGAYPIPFACLVFRGFSTHLSGRYMCTLAYGNTRLATRTTHLHFFAPSYRVVPLPRCFLVPRGGTVLLPSPVQGRPPRPPTWTLLEGEQGSASARTLSGRLLLKGLQGPAGWRAEVTLGGGLTFLQDVFVSVVEGGIDGGGS